MTSLSHLEHECLCHIWWEHYVKSLIYDVQFWMLTYVYLHRNRRDKIRAMQRIRWSVSKYFLHKWNKTRWIYSGNYRKFYVYLMWLADKSDSHVVCRVKQQLNRISFHIIMYEEPTTDQIYVTPRCIVVSGKANRVREAFQLPWPYNL